MEEVPALCSWALSYTGVLASVHRNSRRWLNFQEFCELVVKTVDILKLAIVALSVVVQVRAYPACLKPLFALAPLYFRFPQLEDLSMRSEEQMDFSS